MRPAGSTGGMVMAKADNKTQQTDAPVEDYLSAIADERRRAQCREVHDIMQAVTRRPAKMWGTQIVGFGSYHYVYDSGREGDFMLTGFSSRKQNLTIYIMGGFERHAALMEKLGPHKLGKSCLYIRDLDAIDKRVLKQLVRASVAYMRKTYPTE